MQTAPLTLADFFDLRSGNDVASKVLSSDEQTPLHAHLKGVQGFDWDMVSKALSDSCGKILDVNLVDIFCGGWVKLLELQAYLDRSKYPPKKVSFVPLATHKISSKHQPSLEILLGPKQIAKVTLDVVVALTLEGFILKIQDGCIWEIVAGTYQGIGTIEYQGHTLAKKSTPQYQLPGKTAFQTGIQIPRLGQSASLRQSRLQLSSRGRDHSPQTRLGHPIAFLVGIDGPVMGQRFAMEKAHFRIGRSADSDLRITGDNYVSGYHASLRYERGRLLLCDQNSLNGTYLNAKRVIQTPFMVQHGDHVQIGQSVFQVSEVSN